MNKRHYEHTLPNIRGSLSNTYEFPDMKGFSYRNIRSIKQWYLFYNEPYTIWQQVVSKLGEEKFFSIPWGHHLYIISQCKEVNLFGERQLNNKTGNIYGR